MVFAAACALAGCSAGPSVPGRAAHSAAAARQPVVDLVHGLSLPLERYMADAAIGHAVAAASARLTEECMARYGVAYAPAGAEDGDWQDAANMTNRYGVSSTVQAERYGYHYPHPAQAAPKPLTRAQYTVLTATAGPARPGSRPQPVTRWEGRPLPAGGCAGEVRRELGTDHPDSLVPRLDAQTFFAAEKEPAVQAAIRAWSSCMDRRGYHVGSPLSDTLHGAAGPDPSSQEQAEALADVECKSSTRLVRTWFDAEVPLQRRQIAAHRAELDRIAARLAQTAHRAGAAAAS